MIYGAILAGGTGTRMQRTGLPKQFLPLGDKPVIIHTVEQFLIHPKIDRLYVAVPQEWLSYAEDLFDKHENLCVVVGGSDRNSSLMAVIEAIEADFGITDNDIIVSHDAVRPFVTQRIIDDNIAAGLECGAVDTVVPVTDTIVESNGEFIDAVPLRSRLYHGQTPQTFNIKQLKSLYESLSGEERTILTDACKIFVIKEKRVKLVQGEYFNIKITTSFDLEVANALLRGERA